MEVINYWVYTHTTPDGMVYVGMSSEITTNRRWQPCKYKKTKLEPYIKKYGWENITHTMICDNLEKEKALKLEGNLISKYKYKGICINKNNSNVNVYRNRKFYQVNNRLKKKIAPDGSLPLF